MPLSLNASRAALVVAHPSHELRLHGWLEKTRPYVCILTDGAGRSGEPRLPRTSEVLARVGATPGVIFGRFGDLEVYEAILKGNSKLFAELVEELARAFVEEQIEYVVGDATEGYSVTHDICRVMIDAAVELAKRRHRHDVANFDFLVIGPPDECPDELRNEAIRIELDDESFARKVKAALAYSPKLALDVEAALAGAPFQGIRRFSEPQLAGEVDVELSNAVLADLELQPALRAGVKHVVDGVPIDAFRIEYLRPTSNTTTIEYPFYELYGEKLVAAGRYEKVIRYREHMAPLAEAIRARVEREEHWVRSAS